MADDTEVAVSNEELLCNAILAGQSEVAQSLLEQGITPFLLFQGHALLFWAVEKEHLPCVTLLVDWVKNHFDEETVREFLGKSDGGATGMTALGCAYVRGRPDIADFLILNGAEIGGPLYHVALSGNEMMTERLLKLKLEPNPVYRGKSVLQHVFENEILNKWAIISLLVKYGATLASEVSSMLFHRIFKVIQASFDKGNSQVEYLISDVQLDTIFSQFYDLDHEYTLETRVLLQKIKTTRQWPEVLVVFPFSDIMLMARLLIKLDQRLPMRLLSPGNEQKAALVKDAEQKGVLPWIGCLHFFEYWVDGQMLLKISTMQVSPDKRRREEFQMGLQVILNHLQKFKEALQKNESYAEVLRLLTKAIQLEPLKKEEIVRLNSEGNRLLKIHMLAIFDEILSFQPLIQSLTENQLLLNGEDLQNALFLRQIILQDDHFNTQMQDTTPKPSLDFLRGVGSQKRLRPLPLKEIAASIIIKHLLPPRNQKLRMFEPAAVEEVQPASEPHEPSIPAKPTKSGMCTIS